MNSFSEELRALRVSKNIPLYEIAARTKISIKYLESIEQGIFDFLPIPFARAILRQYAEFIDYSPTEAMKKFDVIIGKVEGKSEALKNVSFSSSNIPISDEKSTIENISERNTEGMASQQKIRRVLAISTIIFLIVVVAIYIFQYSNDEATTIKEEPFQEVIAEKEISKTKTTEEVSIVTVTKTENDSLILTVTTIDSVWFSISTDELLPKNYLFGKNITKVFRAKEYFIVSAGVGIYVKFKLNNKDLGFLGKRGASLRNVKIDKDFFSP